MSTSPASLTRFGLREWYCVPSPKIPGMDLTMAMTRVVKESALTGPAYGRAGRRSSLDRRPNAG